ncbi:hypothetical protein PYCC9005_004517 [Savitreella phatthalungensis]
MSLSDVAATLAKLESRHARNATLSLVDKLDQGIAEIQSLVASGAINGSDASDRIRFLIDRFQNGVADEQKDLYNVQLKHSKAIAKRFKTTPDLATAAAIPATETSPSSTRPFEGMHDQINQAIAVEFVRQGHFDLADLLSQEAGLEVDPQVVAAFRELHEIVNALDGPEANLLPAIAWAQRHREELAQRKSNLEFELHRQQFIRLFRTVHVFDTMQYAIDNFPRFAGRHSKEVAQLMGSLAFSGSSTSGRITIDTSPYRQMFTPASMRRMQQQLKTKFISEFTGLLRMTPTSPLLATVQAAVIALPTLVKFSALKFTGERPGLDIPLPSHLRFHSVFVCPVTKEVGGDAFMLACGHVIGAEAMHSLARGTHKLKCPYCPVLSSTKQALKLRFD